MRRKLVTRCGNRERLIQSIEDLIEVSVKKREDWSVFCSGEGVGLA